MPIQYIIEYLKQYRDKFPLNALKKKLIEAGYPEKEIEEAIKIIEKSEEKSTSFWDFKHKKVYLSTKEKFLDFIFGAFMGIILPLLIGKTAQKIFKELNEFELFPFYIPENFYALIISAISTVGIIIYFFKIKRFYISFGMIFLFFSLVIICFFLFF